MNAPAFEHDSGLDEEMQMPSTESLWCAKKQKTRRKDLYVLNWKLSINLCDLFEWQIFFVVVAYFFVSRMQMVFFSRLSLCQAKNECCTCSQAVCENEKQSENEKKWRRAKANTIRSLNSEFLNSHFSKANNLLVLHYALFNE